MLIDFRTLFPKYNIKSKGVLHVGANIGEEAPIYLELGIKKQIWIEANPIIYERLKDNIKNNPEAKAFNYCISDRYEKVKFNISNNGSQSSSILELGTHKIAHPEVHYIEEVEMDAIPIADIILDDCYDLLNIDLQGAELKALRGMGNLLNQFKWVYLEVNKEHLYVGCDLIDSVDLFMLEKGFRRVETMWCGNTGWGDALYIKQW